MTKQQAKTITILSIIIFILAFMVSGRLWFRLDLTKTKAHTISKVSRNLHAEIPDNVNITYYLSNKLSSITPAPREIEDMLREFAAHSKGKIRVTVRDPVRANLTETIERLGFVPRQIPIAEQGQTNLVTIYSGIVIEYLDRIEVIPWIISTNTLEYDLTSRIRSMVTDIDRQIGIIVGDSYRQWREDFVFLDRTLSDAGYRVRFFSAGDEIPDNFPSLFIFGGAEDFDEPALYRIDRYIQMGGKVLFAVEGVFVDTVNGTLEARQQNDLGLLAMLASYGVVVRPDLVLDRNALSLQYQTRLQSGAIQHRIVRYPFWIRATEENSNQEHPVMAGFVGLDLYWASPLELHPTENVQAVPLFTSSPNAWLMRESFITSPEMAFHFEKDLLDTRGTKILGAALTGNMPSFFDDEDLQLTTSFSNPARIIVIGDTDFATNIISATNAAHNLEFLLRMADWLSSDDDIVSIRNRQPHIGNLDRITDEAKRAATMRFSQVVNVVLIPLFVIAAGIYLSVRRKKSALNTTINQNEKAV